MPKRTEGQPEPVVTETPNKKTKEKKVKEAAPEQPPQAGENVRLSPLQESFKKMLREAGVDLETIFELSEREVKSEDGAKTPCVFATFSGVGSTEIDETVNVAAIKEVLFFYHTATETMASGKAAVIQIVPPKTKDDTHILCYHEE